MPVVVLQPESKEPDLLASVRAYWTRQRGSRPLPRRKDIAPSDIKKWLPQVLLVDVINGGADFRYRLVGGHLVRFFGSEPSGKLMSDALAPFGDETVQKTLELYRAALTLGEPLRIRGDGEWYGRSAQHFDAILTPLSDDGVTVNMIFGAFDFMWNFDLAESPAKSDDDETWDAAVEALS
jgi:hypothetical protein